MLDYQFMTTKKYREQRKAFDFDWQQAKNRFLENKDNNSTHIREVPNTEEKYSTKFVNGQFLLYERGQLVPGFYTHTDILFHDGIPFTGVYQNGYYENGAFIFKNFHEDEDLYLFYSDTSNEATLYYALHQTTNVKIHQFDDVTISNGGTITRASIITSTMPGGQECLWLRLMLDNIQNDQKYTLRIRDLTFYPMTGSDLLEEVSVQASFSFVATRKWLHETVHYGELLTFLRQYRACSDTQLAAISTEEFEIFGLILNQFISLLHLQNIDERLEKNFPGNLPLPLKLRSYLVSCLAVITLCENMQMRIDRVLHTK